MSNKGSAIAGLIAFILGVVGVVAVLKIINDVTKEKKYVCPNCGYTLRRGINKCPKCQTSLRWV